MQRRSRTATREIIKRIEQAGVQIIPRGSTDAYIEGPVGLTQLAQLEALWPLLREHWQDVLRGLGSRDGVDAATATMRVFLARTGESEKNPAAVALGKLGGSKGGKIRAKNLSKKRRVEIGKKAARARWGKLGIRARSTKVGA